MSDHSSRSHPTRVPVRISLCIPLCPLMYGDAAPNMVAYLWLVWYEAPSRRLPKHWALAVTYETHERAYATFYEVIILIFFSNKSALQHCCPRPDHRR